MTSPVAIPFSSPLSFVVRNKGQDEAASPELADELGRSPEDRRFAEQFKEIFLAASQGDLATCQRIVREGFRDFDAYSVGKFADASGTLLNKVSVLEIAQKKNHKDIVEFFLEQQRQRSS